MYAKVDLVLPDKTQNELVYLLGDNFDFDNIATLKEQNADVSTNAVNPNYATIQTVYSLVLMNLLTEENRRFVAPSIAADVRKISPRADDDSLLQLATTVGECYIEYNLNLLKGGGANSLDVDEIQNEIRECSIHNPYAETQSKSSVLSLTFQDALFRDVHVSRLPQNQSVTMRIPVESREEAVVKNLFVVDGNDLVYTDPKTALGGIYGGEQNTDLWVVVSVTSRSVADASSGSLHFHRSESVEPSKGNLSSTVVSTYSMNADRKISFHVNGR